LDATVALADVGVPAVFDCFCLLFSVDFSTFSVRTGVCLPDNVLVSFAETTGFLFSLLTTAFFPADGID
jgi:hypothetical protein